MKAKVLLLRGLRGSSALARPAVDGEGIADKNRNEDHPSSRVRQSDRHPTEGQQNSKKKTCGSAAGQPAGKPLRTPTVNSKMSLSVADFIQDLKQPTACRFGTKVQSLVVRRLRHLTKSPAQRMSSQSRRSAGTVMAGSLTGTVLAWRSSGKLHGTL